jgi:hypothetical protein
MTLRNVTEQLITRAGIAALLMCEYPVIYSR